MERGNSRLLLSEQSLLLRRQKASHEVTQTNLVRNDASNIQLSGLEVNKLLDGLVSLVLSNKSTQRVEHMTLQFKLDRETLPYLIKHELKR